MILTNCACCAAPLPHLAKQCSRCKTRYCGPACQAQHWKEGGHDKVCKTIKRGGGAEQYYANKKYAEAVSVAVEKCAEDTKGQTCYICTEAFHRHTKEGLVRGCACHTTEGFVHVSCLEEQAKILLDEAEENNLDVEAKDERFWRWYKCSLCEQHYHGVMRCALGWACWKTYVGRPETDVARGAAMSLLGNGLSEAKQYEDALSVETVKLSMIQRLGDSEQNMLIAQGNLASTYRMLGRLEESISLRRDVYFGTLKLFGEENKDTLLEANNYANILISAQRFKEAKMLLRKTIPVARRVLGDSNEITIRMRWSYAEALYPDTSATLEDLREAANTLEDTERTARRVLGGAHPTAVAIEQSLYNVRAALRARGVVGV